MADIITLAGDFGYSPYKITGLTATVIDASSASWVVSNIGDDVNTYPFSVRYSSDVTGTGGTINGEVPLDLDWEVAYVNSAAVYMREVSNAVISDWTISQAWDAIRINGDDSHSFTIDRVWLTDIRDDGVENDDGISGTISNSLFDGVFVGVSLADSDTTDQTDNVVTLDNVLIRMQSFFYKGELTHQPIFKVEEGISPGLSIHNSVLAIEDADHHNQRGMAEAWDSVVSASGNYFLNLSDDPLPDDYPLPPAGFTILQGQAARDYWAAARAEWIAEYGGEDHATGTTGNDQLTITANADVLDGLAGNDTLWGGKQADTLRGGVGDDVLHGGKAGDSHYGGDGADTVNGASGNDRIFGGTGADFLCGGTGADTIHGGNEDDLLRGWTGDDVLRGGAGSDRLQDNFGSDTLFGGTGNDFLFGGAEADVLTGGAGRDRFIFRMGFGQDHVTDFADDVDRIKFHSDIWDGSLTKSEVIDRFAYSTGDSVVFDFGNGDVLTISGLTDPTLLLNDLIIG